MKKMKRVLTSLFGGLMGVLGGMTGCSDDGGGITGSTGTSGFSGTTGAYMGMSPSFSGKVLNNTGNTPLSNIRVELLRNNISLNTNRTDGNGNFQFWLADDYYNKNYTLRITDTDGTDNGGDFKGKTNTYLLTDYTSSTNITLEERE